ncbi:MAG: YraN family protein [Ignavibacteriales bacterium]|nr:YraN family protein [Ignavibacteriales bacterium]
MGRLSTWRPFAGTGTVRYIGGRFTSNWDRGVQSSHRTMGKAGEDAAAEYLQRKGFRMLERNYVFDHGEIDIIAADGKELVFVEVKLRRSGRFGTATEAITPSKQELLRRTAEGYVAERCLTNVSCRFDVIALQSVRGKLEITHLRDAFC